MSSNKRKKLIKIFTPVLMMTILVVFFQPQHLPLPVLVLPYVLIFIIATLVSRWLISLIIKRKRKAFDFLAYIIGAFTVLALVLASIGQLSVIDAVIIGVLTAAIALYINRLDIVN